MKGRIISMGGYKTGQLTGTTINLQPVVEKTLPEADRLWELLDRNIGISVWEKEK